MDPRRSGTHGASPGPDDGRARQGATARSGCCAARTFFRERDRLREDFPEFFGGRGGPKRGSETHAFADRGATTYGEWTSVIRLIAHHNPDRANYVLTWFIRDGLLCAVELQREAAERQYMNQLQIWATLAPHQKQAPRPPKVPAILETIRHGK